MVVCLRCLLHHILSFIAYTFPGNRDFVFIVLCRLWRVQIAGYVLACRSYSFVCTQHNLIMSIVQTYLKTLDLSNAFHIYFVECVRLSIFSQLSIVQYMELCVFSLLISTVMIERIYTLSYYHHQIGSMNYYPLFRVMLWNNGMHCMFLYIVMGSLYGICNASKSIVYIVAGMLHHNSSSHFFEALTIHPLFKRPTPDSNQSLENTNVDTFIECSR